MWLFDRQESQLYTTSKEKPSKWSEKGKGSQQSDNEEGIISGEIVYLEISTKTSLQMKRSNSPRNPTLQLMKNRVPVTKSPEIVQLPVDFHPVRKPSTRLLERGLNPFPCIHLTVLRHRGWVTRQMTPHAKLQILFKNKTTKNSYFNFRFVR